MNNNRKNATKPNEIKKKGIPEGMEVSELVKYTKEFAKKANSGIEPFRTLAEQAGNYTRMTETTC
jgi:hypothetical protein